MPNEAMRKFFDTMDAQGLMLTYDDVRLRANYSDVLPHEADTSTFFSRRIRLKIPIVSSPMDTVTTSAMAIAMAEAGGLGVIHRGMSPEDQAKEIARVKNHLNARIESPITVHENDTVAQVLMMRKEKGYSFHSFPVLNSDGRLVGIITRNDFDLCPDKHMLVGQVMTPFDDMAIATGGIYPDKALQEMMKRKKKVLPIITSDRTLVGMYVLSDLLRMLQERPGHALDKNGQLLVAAAVGSGPDALVRAELLAQRKCDVFQIDTAHGDSRNVINTLEKLKKRYPDIDVVAGNVSSGDGAKRLADAGADGVMVGQGPGSICTTRIVAGIGVPQVSAVYECVRALEGTGVPVCADGGINNSGDIAIALAVGASSVMLGRLLAGTDEAPGEVKLFQGERVKEYRGMGSLGAMRENESSRARYGQQMLTIGKLVPEGVEGAVSYRGSVHVALQQYVGGVRANMGYVGARTISDVHANARIFRFTGASLRESHPHDIIMTVQAPNYSGR